jgi:hypothetical protein
MKNSGSNHDLNRRNSGVSTDLQNDSKKIHSSSEDQIPHSRHSGKSKSDLSSGEKSALRKNHLSDES